MQACISDVVSLFSFLLAVGILFKSSTFHSSERTHNDTQRTQRTQNEHTTNTQRTHSDTTTQKSINFNEKFTFPQLSHTELRETFAGTNQCEPSDVVAQQQQRTVMTTIGDGDDDDDDST